MTPYLNKFIEKSTQSSFYSERLKELDKQQIEALEALVLKLDKAGASEPLSWAYSEVAEGIPQFARFLVLKSLFKIINDPKESVVFSEDLGEDMSFITKAKKHFTDDELSQFLKSFTKGVLWQVAEFMDVGNPNYEEEGVNWTLFQTDSDDESNKMIQGLQESFHEFENDLKL